MGPRSAYGTVMPKMTGACGAAWQGQGRVAQTKGEYPDTGHWVTGHLEGEPCPGCGKTGRLVKLEVAEVVAVA